MYTYRRRPWHPTPVLSPGNSHGRRSLQSMGSLRVGHDWVTSLSLFTFMHWRRQWQPTPVFLPGESQGRGSLVGCHLWGRTESDTTEVTQQQQRQYIYVNLNLPIHPAHTYLLYVQMSVLYVCVSIPAWQKGSSVSFFQIPHTCINRRYPSFSLWLTSLCMTDSMSIHISMNGCSTHIQRSIKWNQIQSSVEICFTS